MGVLVGGMGVLRGDVEDAGAAHTHARSKQLGSVHSQVERRADLDAVDCEEDGGVVVVTRQDQSRPNHLKTKHGPFQI
eukprot:scaffold27951_cov129-Isochrysis_galbana.AAC.1